MTSISLSPPLSRESGCVARITIGKEGPRKIEEGDVISISSPNSEQEENIDFALVIGVEHEDESSISLSERLHENMEMSTGDTIKIQKKSVVEAETVIVALPDEIKAEGPLPPALRKQFRGCVIRRFYKVSLNFDKTPTHPALTAELTTEIRDLYPDDGIVVITEDTDLIAAKNTRAISSDDLPTHAINKYLQKYADNQDRSPQKPTNPLEDRDNTPSGKSQSSEDNTDNSSGDEHQENGEAQNIENDSEKDGRNQSDNVDTGVYGCIGGYNEELHELRELAESPIENPEIFTESGISLPSGILLYGPQGVGKTLFGDTICNAVDANTSHLSISDLIASDGSSVVQEVTSIVEEAKEKAPSIVFIDNLEAAAQETSGKAGMFVIERLKDAFEKLDQDDPVIVIGATNDLDALNESLRRPSRFSHEIGLPQPSSDARQDILQVHTRDLTLESDVDLSKIASQTQGYVGEDLEELVNRASLNAIQRSTVSETNPDIASEENEVVISTEDLENALKETQPTNLENISTDIPDISWGEIGGLTDVKNQLRRVVEWPLKYPEKFEQFDIKAASGILLYGPPGTGKTMLAKAIANETDSTIMTVEGPELMERWVGASEKNVRHLFEQARQNAPTVILFDEIDALAQERNTAQSHSGSIERVVAQLLTELDGLNPSEEISVVATTNQPTAIDQAFLRAGRFDYQIHVPAPNESTRREIFEVHAKEKPLSDEISLDEMAALTQGYVGADIEAVCRDAAMFALDDVLEETDGGESEDDQEELIRPKHFREALDSVSPTADEKTRVRYERIETELNKSDTVSLDDVKVDDLPN